ncbi:MAG: MBL fold metallo-hydrolase [Bryobacterales bacterium]|nr:MBL fold metallo-hydrolase [Bryobacterales bacterium]
MIHEILAVGPLACNCSVFWDETSREAIVVDPGDELDQIEAILRRHRLGVKAILITHAHLDHVGAAEQLRVATGAPVFLHPADLALLDQLEMQAAWLGMAPPGRVRVEGELKEGSRFELGPVRFEVLHTPGHTPGSVCLWMPKEKKLVSGDTLFRDSIGRTDLPGGDGRQILRSIREKLLTLPEETFVIPGHGPCTTLERERRLNYFLQHL